VLTGAALGRMATLRMLLGVDSDPPSIDRVAITQAGDVIAGVGERVFVRKSPPQGAEAPRRMTSNGSPASAQPTGARRLQIFHNGAAPAAVALLLTSTPMATGCTRYPSPHVDDRKY
jgi:hypothetical protein